MSNEKQHEEAMRWLRQAKSDLEAARISLAGGKYEWACFQAQQASEKAVKAIWFYHDFDPWGHSVRDLMAKFPEPRISNSLSSLLNDAAALDKLYIPTRYPNGLPDIAPVDSYTRSEAESAITASKRILDKAHFLLG